jgi:hypothetical protein
MNRQAFYSSIRASYESFDRRLTKSHPHLRVLQLPALLSFSLFMSSVAAFYGRFTPGTPSNVNNTNGVATAWFLFCCLAATYWLVSQWRARSSFPAGCSAGFAWSTMTNAICIGLVFLPVAIYAEQNTSAIREMVPLQAIFSAYEELDTKVPSSARYRGDTARHGPSLRRYDPRSLHGTFCHRSIRECIDEGYVTPMIFDPEPAWCAVDVADSTGREIIDIIYGPQFVNLCNSLPDTPFGIPVESWGFSESDDALNDAWNHIRRNMERIYAAHGAHVQAEPFRGQGGAFFLGMFVCLLSSLVSMFSIVTLRVIGSLSACLVGLLAFAMMLNISLNVDRDFVSIIMRSCLVGFPLLSMAFLGRIRHRTPRGDVLCAIAATSVPFFVATWFALTPLPFAVTEVYGSGPGLQVTVAQSWTLVSLPLFLLTSPLRVRE